MKRNRFFAFFLACVMTLSLAACGEQQASAPNPPVDSGKTEEPPVETVTLSFAHDKVETHPVHQAALRFKELVEEKTGGTVQIDIFPNQDLGSPTDVAEQVSLGTIDINVVSPGIMDKYSNKYYTVEMPFAFDNYDHAHKVLDGPFNEWVGDDLEEFGFHRLSNWEFGFRQLTSNTNIETVDDMNGLLIRTPSTDVLVSLFSALGSNVQIINYSELYTSLKNDVIDAEENPIATIYADKLNEVQANLYLTNHYYDFTFMIINTGSWENKLNDEQREAVSEASKEAGDYCRELTQSMEDEYLEKLASAGMRIVDDLDLDAFRAKMTAAYNEIIEVVGQEYYDAFWDMVNENRV